MLKKCYQSDKKITSYFVDFNAKNTLFLRKLKQKNNVKFEKNLRCKKNDEWSKTIDTSLAKRIKVLK